MSSSHDEHLAAMQADMAEAFDKYTTAHPTTAAMTSNAGAVCKGVFDQLQASGFSLLEILPKLFAIVSMIQKYGGDIAKIIEEFKQIFGQPGSVPAPK